MYKGEEKGRVDLTRPPHRDLIVNRTSGAR